MRIFSESIYYHQDWVVPFWFGKSLIETSSHTWPGIGKGCSSPAGWVFKDFCVWHTVNILLNAFPHAHPEPFRSQPLIGSEFANMLSNHTEAVFQQNLIFKEPLSFPCTVIFHSPRYTPYVFLYLLWYLLEFVERTSHWLFLYPIHSLAKTKMIVLIVVP